MSSNRIGEITQLCLSSNPSIQIKLDKGIDTYNSISGMGVGCSERKENSWDFLEDRLLQVLWETPSQGNLSKMVEKEMQTTSSLYMCFSSNN